MASLNFNIGDNVGRVHKSPAKYSQGDKVRLRLALDELDGKVLESPDSEIVLIKLDSGYNIGIKKENILASRVLKKFNLVEEEKFLPKKNNDLPSIGLVISGGTIASKLDAKTGGVKPLTSLNEFAKFYPEVFESVNVKKIISSFMISSESMSSEHWIGIAKAVKELVDDNEIHGVVVTHGTDTLSYTASALSFFLRNLNKPVVLTYSQRSIDRASSDAHLNLECAVRFSLSDFAGVVLVGHGSVNDDFCFALSGTKVRKMHSSRRDAFQPINSKPVAKVFSDSPENRKFSDPTTLGRVEGVEFFGKHKLRSKENCELDVSYSDKVALVKIYPGQDPSILDFYALKYRGIVLEGTGLGHVPSSDSLQNWIPALKKHIRNGLVVCMTTQCLNGKVDGFVYGNGRELIDAGVIFLEDILPETALVKLGFVLGHYGWKNKVKEKMLENFSGEIGERLVV